MKQYEDYIARYCRTGRCTPEEAQQQAICKAVKEYYATEIGTTPTLRHEFNCLSES